MLVFSQLAIYVGFAIAASFAVAVIRPVAKSSPF